MFIFKKYLNSKIPSFDQCNIFNFLSDKKRDLKVILKFITMYDIFMDIDDIR